MAGTTTVKLEIFLRFHWNMVPWTMNWVTKYIRKRWQIEDKASCKKQASQKIGNKSGMQNGQRTSTTYETQHEKIHSATNYRQAKIPSIGSGMQPMPTAFRSPTPGSSSSSDNSSSRDDGLSKKSKVSPSLGSTMSNMPVRLKQCHHYWLVLFWLSFPSNALAPSVPCNTQAVMNDFHMNPFDCLRRKYHETKPKTIKNKRVLKKIEKARAARSRVLAKAQQNSKKTHNSSAPMSTMPVILESEDGSSNDGSKNDEDEDRNDDDTGCYDIDGTANHA